MSKFDYIYKTKFRKMGIWNLQPLDSFTWHSLEGSEYFKDIFGFGKGTFLIHTLDDDTQHPYFPQFYIDEIYDYIKKTNEEDVKKLEQIIKTFYNVRVEARKEIPKIKNDNLKELSNDELVELFKKNRDWAHRVTPYDQFGWIAEDYWTPVMEKILIKYGLKKDSDEYLKALFILTKPEEISTTLKEKREIIKQVIDIKNNKNDIDSAAEKLAEQFGWMPVFAYGTPWDKDHYIEDLGKTSKQEVAELESEYKKLRDYTEIRNREVNEMVQEYKINEEDLQKFIDFGLALDARNEAEYLVSLCGFHVLPIYDEIARRLYISVGQLRNMVEYEVIDCLQGKSEAQDVLEAKGKITGWVYNKEMDDIKYLDTEEAQKFFDYLNKTSKNLQGDVANAGKCASPGRVDGVAKILFSPSENDKVKKGDILIANTTTVDYLPSMKAAAAFVTEVGGLTCHAAVVAREFGVPCIVGLKDATKNFKDGDRVEVNANEGEVKKI